MKYVNIANFSEDEREYPNDPEKQSRFDKKTKRVKRNLKRATAAGAVGAAAYLGSAKLRRGGIRKSLKKDSRNVRAIGKKLERRGKRILKKK